MKGVLLFFGKINFIKKGLACFFGRGRPNFIEPILHFTEDVSFF